MFTFRNVRILFAAALLAAIFCLAGCSTAAQAVPQPAETSRSAEATPETAAPAPTSTPAPTATPEPPPAAMANCCAWLVPANEEFQPIKITGENDFRVWGVVTYVIKKLHKG